MKATNLRGGIRDCKGWLLLGAVLVCAPFRDHGAIPSPEKLLKTEKIRHYEFSVLTVTSNDTPRTLRKLFPPRPQVQELGSENEPKQAPSPREWVIGQAESLLIIGNSARVVEKVVTLLMGGPQ